jgi:hypothetical protein
MKIVSIILTALLLIPVVTCSLAIHQIFYQTKSPLIPKDTLFSIAEPFILYGVSYLVFFCLSILLNIRGKFKINIVLSGFLVLIYLVTINMIKVHG